jgi:protein-S-isoprenylcysteine O-methyltransferase Ste14
MISGVFCMLLGEAILLGSIAVLGWFIFFLVGNMLYIPLVEEPGLVRRFGGAYLLYKRNVPRWISRLRPWPGPLGGKVNNG